MRGVAVTVAVPYEGAHPYLAQAVQSLLTQTHCQLTVVVVNDGHKPSPWPLLHAINDERLVTFDLDRNHGSNFAGQVVLEATRDPFLLIQDANDTSRMPVA